MVTISHAPERIRKYGNLSQSRLSVSGSSTFIASIIREGKSLQAKWKQSSDKKHVLPFRTRRNVATLSGQPPWLPQARGVQDGGNGTAALGGSDACQEFLCAQWVKDGCCHCSGAGALLGLGSSICCACSQKQRKKGGGARKKEEKPTHIKEDSQI